MKYDVLLFDLDDTLMDFVKTEYHALNLTFEAIGLPTGFDDYHSDYKVISTILWDDLEQGRTTLEELKVERFKRLFQLHKLNIDPEQFGQAYIENLGREIHIIEGVVEMIRRHSDYKLAVLTNGFKDAQHARIGGSVLHNSFEAIITSEEAGSQKPQPEIFDYTFEKLKITNRSRVLMIGDSLSSDIQGGNMYGIDTCWFNPYKKTNTSTIQPTYEISSWAEFCLLPSSTFA